MSLRARPPTPEILAEFRQKLWKENRALEYLPANEGAGRLRKHFRSSSEVESEVRLLSSISSQLGPDSVPKVLDASDNYVELEYVEGTRVHNVFRTLSRLQRERPSARDARRLLLSRCVSETIRVQNALIRAVEQEAKCKAYPVYDKLMSLFGLFDHCLELRLDKPGIESEVRLCAEYLESLTCLVPFRDAAPKNLVLHWPEAWLGRISVDDQYQLVERELSRFEDGKACAFRTLPIVNMDFSSCLEMSVPEDDPISLLLHESCWLGDLPTADMLLWQPVAPDQMRLAVGLVVRMYRFGGRRLSYRLVHPTGYAARYGTESIAFYFHLLVKAMQELCPTASRAFPFIMSTTEAIAGLLAEGICISSDSFKDRYNPEDHRYYRDLYPH